MYQFWYDYIKPQYGEKTKLCYTDTDYIQKNIAEDVEIRFVGLNYVLNRQLLKGKTKKIIGLIKDEIGGKTMTNFTRRSSFPANIDDKDPLMSNQLQ